MHDHKATFAVDRRATSLPQVASQQTISGLIKVEDHSTKPPLGVAGRDGVYEAVPNSLLNSEV